jgi:hypothetical protein
MPCTRHARRTLALWPSSFPAEIKSNRVTVAPEHSETRETFRKQDMTLKILRGSGTNSHYFNWIPFSCFLLLWSFTFVLVCEFAYLLLFDLSISEQMNGIVQCSPSLEYKFVTCDQNNNSPLISMLMHFCFFANGRRRHFAICLACSMSIICDLMTRRPVWLCSEVNNSLHNNKQSSSRFCYYLCIVLAY